MTRQGRQLLRWGPGCPGAGVSRPDRFHLYKVGEGRVWNWQATMLASPCTSYRAQPSPYAVVGVPLAAGGIFAVVCYDVGRQTTAPGIRMALGRHLPRCHRASAVARCGADRGGSGDWLCRRRGRDTGGTEGSPKVRVGRNRLKGLPGAQDAWFCDG